MLVRKTAISKKTIILLVILLIVLLPGGYFIYNYFYGSPESLNESPVNIEATVVSEPIVSTFDEEIFEDPQLFNLQRKEFSGFTEQHQEVVLSDDVPLPPKNILVNNPGVGEKLIVSWQLPDNINFNKVYIYRSTTAGDYGEAIAELNVESQRLMNYQNTGLSNNQTYYYLIRTVNIDGQESSNTLQVSGVPSDEFPPDPPDNVQVKTLGDGQIEVSWINPREQDFNGVKIYRSSEKGLVGVPVYQGLGEEKGDREARRYFLDTKVEANINYYYTVTSVDNSGNESTKNILATPYNYNPFIPIEF